MYGIQILSLAYAQNRDTLLQSGLLFAILLCFKHIYLYLAPAYFVYLLRAYCLQPNSLLRIQWLNSIKLGTGIVAIFAAAFGPFAAWGQMPQVLSRLFPFSRGLCHAYWAPNIWAMYSFTDRVLIYGKTFHQALSFLEKLTPSSRSVPQNSRQARRHQQRNQRPRRRYQLRRPPRHHTAPNLPPHHPLPAATADPPLSQPKTRELPSSTHTDRLLILPFWLARPREGYPACSDPIHVDLSS